MILRSDANGIKRFPDQARRLKEVREQRWQALMRALFGAGTTKEAAVIRARLPDLIQMQLFSFAFGLDFFIQVLFSVRP